MTKIEQAIEALNESELRKALNHCRTQRDHWISLYHEDVKCGAQYTSQVFSVAIADDEMLKAAKSE
jgi:hypothetical protein